MLKRIFNRYGAKAEGKGRESGSSANPKSRRSATAAQAEAALQFDITVDDAIRALDAELTGLGHLQVAQAAKERGWASLQRQLEKHPVRATSPAPLKGTGAKGAVRGGAAQPVLAGRSRGWRLALGSAGVAVAIVAVLLGTYSAGLLGNGDGSAPVASVTTTQVASSGTTAPPTSDTTPATTDDPVTTVTTVSTPTTDSTPVTTGSTPTTDSTPVTTEGTVPTSGGSTATTERTTPTTKPAQTTTTVTTSEQQMAAAQREVDAVNAALYLGDAVLDKFIKGELGSLPAINDSARSWLTVLIASLDDPTGCQKVAAKDLTDGKVRVTLEFVDGDKRPRFYITVRVVDGSTTVTDISAGS